MRPNSLSVIASVLLIACVSSQRVYSIASPSPRLKSPSMFVLGTGVPQVDTLSPTFEWIPQKGIGPPYELVVYNSLAGYPAEVAYSVSGLTSTSHRVTTPLQPDRLYLWTVRGSLGNGVSDWASYYGETTTCTGTATGIGWSAGNLFPLHTPDRD